MSELDIYARQGFAQKIGIGHAPALVMVDFVFNHVGYVPNGIEFDEIVPFNDKRHYHEWCEISEDDWAQNNRHKIETCRLFGLPDLNTESEEVKSILFRWIKHDVI